MKKSKILMDYQFFSKNMLKKRDYMKVASYEAQKGDVKKVVLLYAGGVDTSVVLKWIIEEYKAQVITLTLDIGQLNPDFEAIKKKALRLGASKAIVIDVKDEFAEDFIAKAIKTNAAYQGKYYLSSPLAKPLLAKWAIKIASEEGADAIAHGHTGNGNNQVRIEGVALALNPDIKIIAPFREWSIEKYTDLVSYAKEYNIPIDKDGERGYTSESNLWGIASEGGDIQDPTKIPPLKEVLRISKLPEEAEDKPEIIHLEFVKGIPISLNGKQMKLASLIEKVNVLGANHSIGISHHIEDRIIGLKVRGVYESPAAEIIISAHEKLEKYVSTRLENEFKETVDEKWAYLCYGGLWLEPLMNDLNTYADMVNQKVSGKVTVKLYKGLAEIVALETPNGIFEEKLATFMTTKGFNQNASAGFVELYTMQMRLAQRAEKTALLSLGKRTDKIKLLSAIRKLNSLNYKLYATYKTHKFLQKHGIISIEVNKLSQPHLKPNLADLLESNRFDLIINIPTGKHTVLEKEKTDGQIIREKAIATDTPLVTSVHVAEELVDKLSSGKI